jgi:hypothetical protein
MKNSYRACPREELEEWFDRMKVGFKLLYPFSDLSSKIAYYQEKMETVEGKLEDLFKREKEND